MKNLPSKKVLIAISGGVDSSVAAALLKKQGYLVVGVFMKFWSEPPHQTKLWCGGEPFLIRANKKIGTAKLKSENRCCSGDAYESAKSVCAKLDIPFRVLDVQKEFKKAVVDYFLAEYKAGRTPNPCVVCNEEIKFKLLLETAKKWGIELVATGHYARIKREIRNSKSEIRNPEGKLSASYGVGKSKIQNSKQKKLEIGNWKLEIARDSAKDQSYFLYTLRQGQLRHILFPIGDYTKSQVRALAKKWHLLAADRPESFEVCFVPDKKTGDFLKRHLKMKPGRIVDEKGRIVGEHEGLLLYTIGQRHGINIGGTGPYYVIGKNLNKNQLLVTNNSRSSLLFRKELIAGKVSWISGQPPKLPAVIRAKIRYRQPAQACRLEKFETPKESFCDPTGQVRKFETIRVVFAKPQRAVTPGQSVVFYKNREVLGGGEILSLQP